jgi:hypothetical protein
MKMKKALLTSIAVLLLATGTVHATAAELPEAITNENWRTCWDENGEDIGADDDRTIFAPDNGAECEDRGWPIYVRETGYSAPGYGVCKFDKIEEPTPNVYRVHASCEIHWSRGKEHGTDFRTENFELEIIDGHLVWTHLSEG